jgi:hypothetical protein
MTPIVKDPFWAILFVLSGHSYKIASWCDELFCFHIFYKNDCHNV